MSNKQKGSKNERELYHKFIEHCYRAVRVAGSGTMDNADCDLIAGKKGRKYAIEAKSTKKSVQYISKEQMSNFVTFSDIFKLQPVIAVRFDRVGWYFMHPRALKDAGKTWVITLEDARKKGKKFSQFFL